MDLEDREYLKDRLLEAYKKFHSDSEIKKGYANNITHYDDNPFFHQLEKDFKSIPEITFNISNTWFKELYKTNKGRKPEFINAVEAFINIANEGYETLKGKEKKKLSENSQDSINNHISNTDANLIGNSNSLKITNQEIKKNLDGYYKKLIEEHSEIRLDVVGFKLPISSYIQTPIFEKNKNLSERKYRLEKRLNEILKDSSKDGFTKENILKELYKIKSILSKAHNIFDVLEYGKDVFILAPAGMGKTTTLRWIAYKLSEKLLNDSSGNLILPVFVELKFYTKDIKNLHELVLDIIDSYGFSSDEILKYELLFLLDGYDEYNLDSNKLLNEIIKIKRKYKNSRVFFTGRNLPNFLAHNLDFVTYSLSELQENDIKSMFISYLGNYHGISCYDFIENSGVKDLLRNPLYTAFVLVLLKDNLSFGKLDIQKVKKIILNKSLLFDDLIIQKFIKLYEADKANIDQELRELYKNKEISILSNMAYHMTYDVGDTEQLEVEVAKKFFEDLGNPILILKEFREHNILKVHGSYISFENKEIRLFFTAKHLIKKIQNYNDFLKFKDKFKNNKPINIFESNRNTWDNIQEFLLGMFQISQVIDTNLFPKKPEMAFLNEKLFDQLKLILNIFEKGYSIHDDSFLNKNYLLKFFRINNIAFKKEKDIGFKSNYWTSIYLILGKLIEKIPIVQKLLPEIVIYRANMDYIDRMSNLDYFWFTTIARRYHLGVNFNDYFQSYKETFIIDDFHTYQFFKGIFKKGGKIEFPEHQINQFVYRFVFNDFNLPDYKAFEELLNSAEKNDKFEFVERYLERGFDNFILFFFNQHKNPNYIRCIKLLYRLKRIGWDFSIKNYSNYPIHIQKNVFDVLFQGAVISKIHRKNFFDKYIFNLIEHIEDEMLKDKLSHEATSFFLSEKSSQDQKLHAFIVVLITDNKKNINTLIGLLDFSKESIFQNLIREKFLELTDKLTHKSKFYKKPSISIIILKLINVYKRETTIENEKILSSFLKKISYSTDKITSEVVLLSTDSNSELYHAILSYFSNNEPTDKKTLNFLINELNNIEYGAWIYNILYNIDIKFFFEFEEKFKKQADSLYLKFFLFYEFPEYGYITYHDIQKVYFICQEESVELFNMILNSNSIPQEKMVKIIGYDFLADIINEKMKKISDYRKNFINKNYPLKG